MTSRDEHKERQDALMAELLTVSGRCFLPATPRHGPVALKIVRDDDDLPFILEPPSELGEEARRFMRELFRSFHLYTRVESTVNINAAAYEDYLLGSRPGRTLEDDLYDYCTLIVDEAIAALTLTVAIAMPHMTANVGPIFRFPRKPEPSKLPHGWESQVHSHSLDAALMLADRLGWPPTRVLPLREVLAWMEDVPGWNRGFGQGRVGRAVAAFSHIVSLRGGFDAEHLLWALMGLEALYAYGKEGLRAQLVAKSQVLLGPPTSDKKRFGKMYDYRSRLVHGDLDLPFAGRRLSDDEARHFTHETDESGRLATVVLLASIQALIARNWHALEFDYHIVE